MLEIICYLPFFLMFAIWRKHSFMSTNLEKKRLSEASKVVSNFILPDEILTDAATVTDVGKFPTSVLPLPLQQIVTSTNACLNYPTDYIGISLLQAAALAIGNACKAEIKKEWQESAILYIAIVGQPGTTKSHPITFALKPIFDKDKEAYRLYEIDKQAFEQAQTMSKAERQQAGIDEPSKPYWQKFIVSDITPEALALVHKRNQRGIGVYCDELATWFKNFNRYNTGAEQELWLSIWSGKPLNIDRKSGEPVYIPMPSISVIGTIQNSVLLELAKNGRRQNGFLDRVLFAMPDESTIPDWAENELSQHVVDTWHTIVNNLLNIPLVLDTNLNPEPDILQFTPDAKQAYIDWYNQNAGIKRLAETETEKGIAAKLDTYCIRFSLILQLLKYACNESGKDAIGIDAVQGAIKLVEYFRGTALKVHSIINNYSPVDGLPTNKRDFYNVLPELFTTDAAIEAGKHFEIPTRTVKDFLANKEFFERVKHGEYAKKY